MSEVLLAVLVGIVAVCLASLLLNKVFFKSLQSPPSSKVRETVTQTPMKAKPLERTPVRAEVANDDEVERERIRTARAERERAEKEKADKERVEKEKADKEKADKEREARQELMEQARQTFARKDDPQFKSDEDLQKVANTIAWFYLKCPTISECRVLVKLCQKLETKQYDPAVLTALKGSECIFQQEVDMAKAGYHKWGKAWVDDEQYAQLRETASRQQQTEATTTGPFPITVSRVRGGKVVIANKLVSNGSSAGGTVVYRHGYDSTVVGPTPEYVTVVPVFSYQVSYTLSNPTKSSQVAVVSLSTASDADTQTYTLDPGETITGDFATKTAARNIIVNVNGKLQLFYIKWSY